MLVPAQRKLVFAFAYYKKSQQKQWDINLETTLSPNITKLPKSSMQKSYFTRTDEIQCKIVSQLNSHWCTSISREVFDGLTRWSELLPISYAFAIKMHLLSRFQ